MREGAQVVILGRPNVGKSTLFNALAGAARAIVTDIPGTTRDLLTEIVDMDGIAVTLVDTAGIRVDTTDEIEAEGIARARLAASRADLALVVLDRSQAFTPDDAELLALSRPARRVVVANKADLPRADWAGLPMEGETIEVAATTGLGLEVLRRGVVGALGGSTVVGDTPALTNMRHVELLGRARAALERAREAASAAAPEELIAADIADARSLLEEITGRRTVDDTLHAIFDRFCIGK